MEILPSVGLRRASRIAPDWSARLSARECSESTMTVTTGKGACRPGWLARRPVSMTSIFSRIVVTSMPDRPGARRSLAMRMSTRSPGSTISVTPAYSSTCNETARIPGGIVAAMPPDSLEGKCDSVIGELARTDCTRNRPSSPSTDPTAPNGTWDASTLVSSTSSAASRVPRGKSLAAVATTTCGGSSGARN